MTMSNTDRAALVIAESITRDSAPAHEIVADLEHEGLLMPDPQIIRTMEELEALDPDTLLIRRQTEWDMHVPLCAQDWKDDWSICPDGIFPLAVVAPAAQVRAAREALEEA